MSRTRPDGHHFPSSPNFLSLASAALTATLLGGCSSQHAQPAQAAFGPMPVEVTTVQQADVPLTNEWVGTLDGFVNAQIQPQVSGYLIKQLYQEGSVVQKGQVLFQIDPRPFEAALQQAKASSARPGAPSARPRHSSSSRRSTSTATRRSPLSTPSPPASSTQRSRPPLRRRPQSAPRRPRSPPPQAAVANAKLNLGFTQVRSLITGVAGQATVQVGNLVSPQSVLTSVSQLDPIKVYFSISDDEYLALSRRSTRTAISSTPPQRSRSHSRSPTAAPSRTPAASSSSTAR